MTQYRKELANKLVIYGSQYNIEECLAKTTNIASKTTLQYGLLKNNRTI